MTHHYQKKTNLHPTISRVLKKIPISTSKVTPKVFFQTFGVTSKWIALLKKVVPLINKPVSAFFANIIYNNAANTPINTLAPIVAHIDELLSTTSALVMLKLPPSKIIVYSIFPLSVSIGNKTVI